MLKKKRYEVLDNRLLEIINVKNSVWAKNAAYLEHMDRESFK